MDEHVLRAQNYLNTFGRIMDVAVEHESHSLLIADFNGDQRDDLVVASGHQLFFQYQLASPFHWRPSRYNFGKSIRTMSTGLLNKDPFVDLVIVSDTPPEIQSLLSQRSGQFHSVWKQPLPDVFEKFILGDIDNDGNVDLLFFGKKQLGVAVWLGNGKGAFHQSPTLFSEYSLSTLIITDINDDGLSDIIGSNWVSNQVVVFSGFGKMSFSNPVVIPCSGEPSYISTSMFDADPNIDLVIGFSDRNSYETYLGDGLGGFHPAQRIDLTSPLLNIIIGDINNDKNEDIISLQDKGIFVKLNKGGGEFNEPEYFSVGIEPSELGLFRSVGNSSMNAVILDTAANQLRLLYNARAIFPNHQKDEAYAVGFEPKAVIATDIDHDGTTDILVACKGSKSISLFLANNNEHFTGQISLAATIPIERIRCLSANDSIVTMVGYSPSVESLAIINVNMHTFVHTITILPTGGPPDVLSMWRDSVDNRLHFFLLESDQYNQNATLILYEQITPMRFLEHTFPSFSNIIPMSGILYDVDRDGKQDFVYLSQHEHEHVAHVLMAKGTGAGQFAGSKHLFTLAFPEHAMCKIWIHDVNSDDLPDLLINIQQPTSTLFIASGAKDTTFSLPFVYSTSSVSIATSDDLSFIDINQGKKTNILFNNQDRKSLQFITKDNNNKYIESVKVKGIDVQGFSILPSLSKGAIDVICTLQKPDVLKLFSFKVHR